MFFGALLFLLYGAGRISLDARVEEWLRSP